MALEYVDFEVKIERRQGKEYTVSVIRSPAGEASGTFTLPFASRRLKTIQETIEIALVRSMMPVRRAVPPEFTKVEQFGRQLFAALFKNDVRSCYDRSSARASGEGKGLRLKLRLDPTLANLPWEFMYSRGLRDYLALCRTAPPVRYVELPQPVAPLEVSPPLRILVAIASPSDYEPLNVEREKERITSALAELQERGIIKVEFLEGKNTLAALQRRLRRADYHVLHFIGHGGYDEEAEEGLLLMEDARGRGRPVSGQWLGRLLRGYFSMRLVILNACEGALTSSSDPFAGVAAAVVGAGVPAVVAMQFEISDEAAIIFSREFYSALADNYPVDGAVTEARMAIVFSRKNTIEWATPVLYMRADDGMLFNVAAAKERVAVAPKEPVKPKEERLAALYGEVQELLAAEDWSGAVRRCGEILALDPTYRDTDSLLVKANDGLDRQKRRRAREERLSRLYHEGMRYLAEGRWREAVDEFKQVLALEEGYKDASARLVAAQEEMAKAEAEKERQKKLSDLYKQGVATLRDQQWSKAVALLQQVQTIQAGYRDTTRLLARARREVARLREEQISALYREGLSLFNEGRWQEAIDKFQQVVDQEEGYKDAAARLVAAREELAKAEAEREKREKLAPKPFPWRVVAIGGAVIVALAVIVLIVKPWRWFATPTPPAVVEATATSPPATPTLRPTATSAPPTPTPALPTSTPAQPIAGATRLWEKDGSVMVFVPAGEFIMGSPEGEGDDDEHPQHTVYLDAFWIDRVEMTNEQYGGCVEAGTCPAPTTCDWGEPTYSDTSKANHPVVCVSWEDAEAYCEWVGKRLPTEAEWEKAARGTDGRKYPWGDAFDGSRLNFCDANCEFDHKDSSADDGYQRTAPVGSYPAGASPYGALDMAGNVWEWCQDWYDADYYAVSPQRDPQGPDSGIGRVVRGGSWYDFERGVRAASRGRPDPVDRLYNVGFRCVSLSP